MSLSGREGIGSDMIRQTFIQVRKDLTKATDLAVGHSKWVREAVASFSLAVYAVYLVRSPGFESEVVRSN
jgi:hypothetical protein